MRRLARMLLGTFLERLKAKIGSGTWSDSGRRNGSPKIKVKRGGRVEKYLREVERARQASGLRTP
ncbi:hypothetical protein KW800_01320 [Candidatus Parcubacteria bacterium]|nr:hypothetical protein [Candidatus Parcubacteria bacterium]